MSLRSILIPRIHPCIFSLILGVSFIKCPAQEDDQRPNIIFIMTDQQAFDAMSCATNPLLNTPALDRLAADGVLFENAYCAYPLCVPSRAAMFTGRMPHEFGIFVNTRVVEDETLPFEMLGKKLSASGYETHYIGKWHLTVPMSDKAVHGFSEVEHPGSHGYDSVYARLAVEFIRKQHKEPYFLTVSFVNPHDCCQLARGENLSGFEGAIPSLPARQDLPALPANFEIPQNEPDYFRQWQRENSERVYRSFYWDEMDFKKYQWGYYRLVEKVDSLLGKVFDAAYTSPEANNTIIIFSSDHGDGLSRHKWNQKWSPYDESAKVPLIIAGKSVPRKGETDSRLVSSGLDLYPTVCDYAGIEKPELIRGRSLKPILEGTLTGEWREYVITEISFGNWVDTYHQDTFPKARMIRTENYKYVAYDRGEIREQLIDMVNDPGEMINLTVDPRYFDVLFQHRAYLREWILKTEDSFRFDLVNPLQEQEEYNPAFLQKGKYPSDSH